MRLFYAITADAAQFTPDGRLWVLGGDFDTIYSPQFPAVHSAMTLAVKLLATPRESEREHQLRVELVDADGQPFQEPFVLPFTPHINAAYPHREVGIGLTLNYQNLRFDRPGDFGFHILVDGLEIGTLPLYVAQLPMQGQQGALP
jgi:hypothetical protein